MVISAHPLQLNDTLGEVVGADEELYKYWDSDTELLEEALLDELEKESFPSVGAQE